LIFGKKFNNMKKLLLVLTLLPMFTNAQQSNDHFSNTVQTKASPEAIWKIWTDVPNWKQWDAGLKEASIDGVFTEGAKGKLVPDKGPKSKFVVTSFEEGKSYTFKTRIPLGWLVVERRLTVNQNLTQFTHEVRFTGLLKEPLGNSFGKRYRALLPEAMEKIKKLAES